MGCSVCNILEIHCRHGVSYEACLECVDYEHTDKDEKLEKAFKEELCNDIAINHPEMVRLINEIVSRKESFRGRKED